MKPILLDFPQQLESKRLLIRAPQPGDGVTVRTAVIQSQPELKQWMPWAVNIPTEEEYEVLVREFNVNYLARKDLVMFLFHKESGELVGGSGLHRIDWEVPKVEIGYWARTSMTGNGYITEATEAITHFAFAELGAKRVEIRCDANNHKSAAIPKRLGFTHEATLRSDSRHHLTNELRDTMIFAKIRP